MTRDLAIVIAIVAMLMLAIRTGEGKAPQMLVRTNSPAAAPQLFAPCPTDRARFIPRRERIS